MIRLSVTSKLDGIRSWSLIAQETIGAYTGPIPFARGTVTAIDHGKGWTLATVDWQNCDCPQRVNVANLAIVGNNADFAG